MAHSSDPDQALRLFVDLDHQLARHPGYYRLLGDAPMVRRRLMDSLGTSEFLGRAIVHFPELIDWLAAARDPTALEARQTEGLLAEVVSRLGKLPDIELKMRSLRRFKLQEQLRIGLLDLGGTLTLQDVNEQLTRLAEVCLRACYALCVEDLRSRDPTWDGFGHTGFAILALGRLGAQEMGYGSDLDLLFIYDAPDAANHTRDAVRLAQRLIQMLTLRFTEGLLYPIDTRLRPSGAQGPLVSDANGFINYHQSRAMLWEKQAVLRARHVAGDAALGERVLQALAPIRYPTDLQGDKDLAARQEIARMRTRMQRELAQETGHESNVKTGRGGLADIEFIVQYQQLKHAHQLPALQVTSTHAALQTLRDQGLVPRREAQMLLRAYRFLRQLESRLRIVHDRPISHIPLEGPKSNQLARRMNYPIGPQGSRQLKRDYLRITQHVRRIFEAMFVPAVAPPSPKP